MIKKLIGAIITTIIVAVIGYNALILTNWSKPINQSKIWSTSKETGVSCLIDNTYKKSYTYQECDKEFKADDWVRFLDADNDDSKIVVWLDGGPMPTFSFAQKFIAKDSDAFAQVGNTFEGYSIDDAPWDVAAVKEIWHMKHNLLMHGMKINVEQAKAEQTEYMKIVNKIVQYYQEQGRDVVLAGHSYGGNQINDFLRVNGTTPDGIISLAGRIAGPNSQAKLWQQRILTDYNLDGSNNDSFKVQWKIKQTKLWNPEDFIVGVFDGATLDYDYTKAIDPAKLTHNNILWYSSERDTPAGYFNQKEKDFAKKYGSLVFKTAIDEGRIYSWWLKNDPDVAKQISNQIPHNFSFLANEMDVLFHAAFNKTLNELAIVEK